MASPASKPPAGTNTTDNDVAEILTAVRDLGDRMERLFEKIDDRLRKVEADVSEVKGRLGELSARVPSIRTMRDDDHLAVRSLVRAHPLRVRALTGGDRAPPADFALYADFAMPPRRDASASLSRIRSKVTL